MSDHDRLRRDVRMLKGYAVVTSACLLILALGAFRQPQQAKARFAELDVERINIVEPDGKLRMVLSNRPRSIGPIYKGKPFGYAGGSRPGIIFFNDEGTENGGLTFDGKTGPDGKYRASSGFSFDQFNQDQILYFQYNDDNGVRRTGFTIADRANADIYDMVVERDSIMKLPEGAVRNEALQKWAAPRNGVPLMAQRIFVGRDPARNAIINLSDPNGKPRLRLKVDSLGAASLEFLDATGTVTSRIPDR
ncbi:MAG TPA: hypothetical protein PLX31_10605 [Gemmatimonadaceae bacterium]|nr:hypothetical protein [Gemmatimonadota bacterium]MBK9978045.1 hypothetical protein [Gemmatimonadota bacterium]HPV75341.1 hypothetical protein [Gemmatimonadaceae bacterium]